MIKPYLCKECGEADPTKFNNRNKSLCSNHRKLYEKKYRAIKNWGKVGKREMKQIDLCNRIARKYGLREER